MKTPLFDALRQKPEYIPHLYRFGYLILQGAPLEHGTLPDGWQCHAVCGWQLCIHPDQKLFLRETPDGVRFLIGHCYDPFAMEHREEAILERLAEQEDPRKALSDLTGVFVTGILSPGKLRLDTDAAGMLMANYGVFAGRAAVSSHAHLLSSVLDIPQRDYVRRLTGYRFYRLFGFFLPGDLSPYEGMRRLVPNHTLHFDGSFHSRRFWPDRDARELCNAYTMDQRAEEAARILKNTMALIPEKWAKPAITLTGGCDSKTTLACAADHRDRYRYFSYASQEAEALDADGAAVICRALGLEHTIHPVPETMPDEELVREIIAANTGSIGKIPLREVRKRILLAQMGDVDVEVKSWVSEVGRAYFHKRFAREKFPKKPTPRLLTTLYKVFFHDRRLVRETDAIFADYLARFLRPEDLRGFDWIDLFFWEFRVGGWNGLVITGEHRYSFDITIPYNNRRLLELMLALPVRDRMEDRLYAMIRAGADPRVDAAGVAITNLKHTSRRAKLEGLYLAVHSRLPF